MKVENPFLSNHPPGIMQNHPIAQFEIGNYKNFVYFILDWKTRHAAIVDPQKNLSIPLEALEKYKFQITQVFLTHTHWDHVAGLPELLTRFPEITVTLHEADLHRIQPILRSSVKIRKATDGEILTVGTLQIKVIHTPGHSAGECCFLTNTTPPYLLTGDTIFVRDCGCTDLPTGNIEEMFCSLQKIKKLPSNSIVLPGHHYAPECGSTLQKELLESPPFACQTVQELDQLP